MRIALSGLLFLFCSTGFAVIHLKTITGMSNTINFTGNPTDTGIEIYGGSAGPACVGDLTNTCNNCEDLAWGADTCNFKRVYTTLRLRFTFNSSTKIGTPKLYVVGNPTNTQIAAGTITTTAGEDRTIDVAWSEICKNISADNDDTTCAESGNKTFEIGIDGGAAGLENDDDDYITVTIFHQSDIGSEAAISGPTNRQTNGNCTATDALGLCNFSLTPGDEKAYVENVTIRELDGGLPIFRARFYCQTGADFSVITPQASDNCADMLVVNNQLEQDIIEGLTNDTQFVFKAAVEDKAGNIGYFTLVGDDNTCPTGTTNCHTVTPSEVAGLFAKDVNCFIATAAYGSPLDSHVDILREFRFKILSRIRGGQTFIRWYYKNSPAWAHWVSQSPQRMWVTRLLLVPVVGTAYAFIYWPWTLSVILLIFGLVIFKRQNWNYKK